MKKKFSKRYLTKWSNKLNKVTEVISDTKASYKTDDLPERCNEALLKKTKVTLKENKDVMKALGFSG